MKRTALMTVTLLLVLTSAMWAQQTSMTVRIPVAFTVEQTSLPPGVYIVTHPSEKALALKRVGGTAVVIALTNYTGVSHEPEAPRLIFHRYGSQYFLAVAWMPNSDQGHEFFASAHEIEMARSTPQQTYEVAMIPAK